MRTRAFEMGIEARQMLYPAVIRSLEGYTPERVRYIVDRYQQGLAEYDNGDSLVAQGFLMPVMFGYFDQSAARTNYEQPIQKWIDEMDVANIEVVVATRLIIATAIARVDPIVAKNAKHRPLPAGLGNQRPFDTIVLSKVMVIPNCEYWRGAN